MGKRRSTLSKETPNQIGARHEAAHAVVSVLLGLPLVTTDIRRRTAGGDVAVPATRSRNGEVGISIGATVLEEGAASAWRDALPNPAARDCLERLGVQIAAGVVAELERGVKMEAPEHRTDLFDMVQVAGVLGVGRSSDDPAVQEWMSSRVMLAGEILFADDGAAWDRVAAALLRKKVLTGDQVRSLVGEASSDALLQAP
ncbi:MAG: hypothetical protein EXR92_05645 [Gemmatimonadetes bacterium]|nr:hypothetical protein [Gemmatimonadota bacterium]